MDIMIIKILDIVIDENEETGDVTTQKLYLPSLIYKKDIEDINPAVCANGRLYKNISNISTYSGKNYVVVGNYKELNQKVINDERISNIGYKNGKQNKV